MTDDDREKLNKLNLSVTNAIFESEKTRHSGDIERIQKAQREVSRIEEEIAAILPPHSDGGYIARVGAVAAAVDAGDRDRAAALAERFSSEAGAPEDLADQLRDILEPRTKT